MNWFLLMHSCASVSWLLCLTQCQFHHASNEFCVDKLCSASGDDDEDILYVAFPGPEDGCSGLQVVEGDGGGPDTVDLVQGDISQQA